MFKTLIIMALMALGVETFAANPPELMLVLTSKEEVAKQVQPKLNEGWEVKHQSMTAWLQKGAIVDSVSVVIVVTLTPPQKPQWQIEDERREAVREADRLEKKRQAEEAAAKRMEELRKKKEAWDKAHPVESNGKP